MIAIPIIDHEDCLVGIVTVDDAMLVLQDETTEDISIMAGVSPSEDSYFGTSVFQHAKSRTPWLMLMMLSATVTGRDSRILRECHGSHAGADYFHPYADGNRAETAGLRVLLWLSAGLLWVRLSSGIFSK